MSNAYLDTLRDEALRIEVGPAAVSDLAVENLELSTPTLSGSVRRSVVARRAAAAPATTGLRRNRLAMQEVRLPPARRPEPQPESQPDLEYCAA
ncbi:MAG TPA: hypothetical protein VK848_00865 [Acidimicrobiia bacterium]|nr:hypothetical protein [Acidimicrobiia bacterium]